MSTLFENSDSETEANIKINNSYAQNYDNWRRKEELNKFRTKYGEQDSSGSTSSSSEDEEVQITEELEKKFFQTLASLKRKDPKIYDKNVKFFDELSEINSNSSKRKDKPMYIKDYERKLLLEKGGKVEESDEEVDEPKSIANMKEQEKKYWKGVLTTADDDNEEWGGMFKSRTKSNAEIITEEEDYKQWLLGQKEDIKDEIKNELKPLKDFWNDPDLGEGEKFLRDYILNKRYVESQDNDYIPTYDEVIDNYEADLSEDEKQLQTQEEFEHKYNYRFEEPDEEYIKRFPRTIESSLRREDDRRKIKRAETKERKQKEKDRKMEEVKQMQALKKKEIAEKINKLKEITGNTDMAFEDIDIEGDFNPEDHDTKMQNLFNEQFYQGQEEEQKPEYPNFEEELEIENWDKYQGQDNNESGNNGPHCEDDNFNMDCDFDPAASTSSEATTKGKRNKKKRKTKFAELLNEPKPTFNPEDKTYEEYLDEYYKLECEDIVGDIPCRFKYRKVTPNSFGLSVEEILSANDRELNKWCSLKKTVQYRPENIEKYDVIAFTRKGQNEQLKRKYIPSLFKVEDKSVGNTSTKRGSNSKLVVKENHNQQEIKKRKLKGNIKKNYEESENKNLDVNLHTNVEPDSNRKNQTISNSNDCNQDNNIVKEETKKRKIKGNTKKNYEETENKNMDINLNTTVEPNAKRKVETEMLSNNKKTKTKKNKTKLKSRIPSPNIIHKDAIPNETSNSTNTNENRKRKRQIKNSNLSKNKTNKFSKNTAKEFDISDARLKAFGIKPKKFKNKIKYGKQKNKMHS